MKHSLSEQHESYHCTASVLSGNRTTLFDTYTYILFSVNSSFPIYDSVLDASGTWTDLIVPSLHMLHLSSECRVQRRNSRTACVCLLTSCIYLRCRRSRPGRSNWMTASLPMQFMVQLVQLMQRCGDADPPLAPLQLYEWSTHREKQWQAGMVVLAATGCTVSHQSLSPNSWTPKKGDVLRATAVTQLTENCMCPPEKSDCKMSHL